MKEQLLSLVAELLESLGGLVVDLGALLGLGKLASGELLALVVGGALGLAALLESTKQLGTQGALFREARASALIEPTYLATTSSYFQPTSELRRPTVQNLRPGWSLRTRRAWGTTIFFFLS